MSMTPEENALINNKLNKLDNNISSLQGDVTRILSYIDNDPKTGKPGLYQQNNSLRNDFDLFVAEYNKKEQYRKGLIVAISATAAGAVELIVLLIKAFK